MAEEVIKYSKEEAIAIEIAKDFIREVNELEKKYNMSLNSDSADIYLSFKTKESGAFWDTVSLGWVGDGSGIKVTEEVKIAEKIKEQALSKLNDEERRALGFK